MDRKWDYTWSLRKNVIETWKTQKVYTFQTGYLLDKPYFGFYSGNHSHNLIILAI